MKRFALSVLVGGLALAGFPGDASADKDYHTGHIAFTAVGDAPLSSGFVNLIHPNGRNLAAVEVYVLNGAAPGTDYSVIAQIYPFDPACEGLALEAPPTALATNAAGNGRASSTIHPSLPELFGFNDATHGLSWEVRDGSDVHYQTDCVAVEFD